MHNEFPREFRGVAGKIACVLRCYATNTRSAELLVLHHHILPIIIAVSHCDKSDYLAAFFLSLSASFAVTKRKSLTRKALTKTFIPYYI